MEEINQNENNSIDLLQNSYSIDNESLPDSNEELNMGDKFGSSLSYNSDDDLHQQRHQLILNFIQAVKDDNVNLVLEICKADEGNKSLVNMKGVDDFYPIHYAVLFGNINMIDTLVDLGANLGLMSNLRLEGIPILHLSLYFSMFQSYRKRSVTCFLHLLKNYSHLLFNEKNINEIYPSYVDRLGRTFLHLIIQYDLSECLEGLASLNLGDLVYLRNLNIKDFNGETVQDYFYIYNSKNCFSFIMESFSHEDDFPFIFYKTFTKVRDDINNTEENSNNNKLVQVLIKVSKRYPLLEEILIRDITNLDANEGESEKSKFYQTLLNILTKNEIQIRSKDTVDLREIPNDADFYLAKKFEKTLISYHMTSYKHGEIQETNFLKRVRRREIQVENPDRLSVLLQPPFGVLLSDFFMENCVFRESNSPACLADILRVHDYEYVETIKKICEDFKKENKTRVYKYDRDTYINQHTWESSIYSAGCVIETVDKVMSGEYSTAICLVRPPGHHAGYFGKVENKDNQSCHTSNGFCFLNNIAIGAAYCKYKYRDQGIKRIAIVDFDVHHGNGTEEIIRLLTKQNFSYKNESNVCTVTVNKSHCHPWVDFDDAKNVLFVSLHGYDEENPGMFYPSTGNTDTNTPKDSDLYPGGIFNVPITHNSKFSHCYRNTFRAKVTPRLIKFQPDIIFISAGFDGHENEYINSAYMKLNELDYRWITEEIMRIAKVHSNSRVISVLEGGYNINTGVASSFAQSVMTHSKFLNIGVNKQPEECKILSKMKRKREFTRDLENYRNYKKFRTEGTQPTHYLEKHERNKNEEDVVFDKTKLRNGRRPIQTELMQEIPQEDQILRDNLNNNHPSKPDIGLSLTPSITPYLNYSKSINELSMNDLQKIQVDNESFDDDEKGDYAGNFTAYENFITHQKNQLSEGDEEEDKYVKVEQNLSNVKSEDKVAINIDEGEEGNESGNINFAENENNPFINEDVKIQSGDNPYEEFEVVMDEEEEISDNK